MWIDNGRPLLNLKLFASWVPPFTWLFLLVFRHVVTLEIAFPPPRNQNKYVKNLISLYIHLLLLKRVYKVHIFIHQITKYECRGDIFLCLYAFIKIIIYRGPNKIWLLGLQIVGRCCAFLKQQPRTRNEFTRHMAVPSGGASKFYTGVRKKSKI